MSRIRWCGLAEAAGLILWAQVAGAANLQQDFATNPAGQGWRLFGDASLFVWDATNQNLQVTWDSSRPNSYFYHPLGTVLTRDDDFGIGFDLRLSDIGPGSNTNKTFAFELAIALLNFSQASSSNFLRGTGTDSPNLVEFDYFRDTGFGATVWPTFISSNSVFNYNGGTRDYTLLALTPGDLFHVEMAFTASNSTMNTTITRNGATFGPVIPVPLSTNFTDFRVDTFAICNYDDAGDDFDSILAHGTVDNLVITTPQPPLTDLAGEFIPNGPWQVKFSGRTNWIYTLERSYDLQTWTPASSSTTGAGSLVLQDTSTVATNAFYRVTAQRP